MESSWLETRWARPFYLAFVFCLALVLLQAIKLYLRRQRLLRDLRCFPAPPTHWLYGHQKFLQGDEMEKLEELVEKYPCAFPRWVGPFQAFFYIYDPEYAKTFLSRTDPKSQFPNRFLSPCIGQGLLNLDGPKWFQHRRLLTPGFHLNILKPYVEVMIHSVNTMLDKWEKMLITHHTTVEVSEHINLMTLDILLKCAFTQETNCQINGTNDPYVKAMFELSKIIFYRMYSFLHHHDIIFNFSPEGHRFQELRQVLHQYTEKIVQDRKKALQDERKQDNTQKRKYQDFLDIVLSAQAENGDIFSDTDLLSEVNTFILAGHDTTAGGISWLLYCLALNPEHQQRCREEIRGILEDGSSIIWDHLGEMSYTTMCIKEALRLIPPIPSISRELSKPITFPDGHSLPAGMNVVLSIWGLHHNSAIWENPKVFDPLRFSLENSDQRHSHAFLPFSAGPRDCIGQQFAMIQLKVAVALILLHFEVTPDPTRPPILSPQIVLKSKNGIHLCLKKIP
ncbi:cytochrome P450 4X1 [Trichechus manatus latirostris]|uniref:Cytochrome P450 4X1 n=1 Tax=Trichechus manatus latirostris TaxID=127582 RepID=A0A2Y9DBX4_TRIMA|nr:cytochrome P450 4X1 [Trichechus manatus latirostris]XP_023582870.1 cytochrome P450 4X1 [Trichechus manatus latirostris]